MRESGTFWDYELAYRRERMMEAGHGSRPDRRSRRGWPTRPRAQRAQ